MENLEFSKIKMRKNFCDLINNKKYKTAVEIGVYKGNFSKILMSGSNLEMMYGVDPWQQKYIREKFNVEDIYLDAIKQLDPYISIGKYKIVRTISKKAAEMFSNSGVQFDFIYLDGDHSYTGITEDLKLWWPLVRVGGCLAGHDFTDWTKRINKENPKFIRKVKSAVIDFFGKLNREFKTTYMDSPKSWWIIK